MVRMLAMYLTYLLAAGSSVMCFALTCKKHGSDAGKQVEVCWAILYRDQQYFLAALLRLLP